MSDLSDQLDLFGNDFGNDPFSQDSISGLMSDFGGNFQSGSAFSDGSSSTNSNGGVSSWLGNLLGWNPGNTFPTNSLIQGLVGMLGNSGVQNTLQGMFNQVLNADPWKQQMAQYQQPLYQAATQGIGGTPYGNAVAQASTRKMASMGYNGSGNMAEQLAQDLNGATPQYMQALTPLAMGRAPDTSGAGMLGLGMGQAQAGMYNALGYGLQGLLQGQRPSPQSSGGGGLGDLIGMAAKAAPIAMSLL